MKEPEEPGTPEQDDSDPPGAEPPSRRGRPPEPIGDGVGAAHRTWLEPVRSRLVASGLTLDELVGLSGYSKTRLSELLRGKGYYPGWEITYSVVKALDLPPWPLRRLWTAAAREAAKNQGWIENRIQAVQPLGPEQPPVAHLAFTQALRDPYNAYARAFLQADGRAQRAVRETFDILWLTWDEALASADVQRHAWQMLRSRVMARALQRDGHPDLRQAAFYTVAQAGIADIAARKAHIDTMADFFDAVARLPQDQMDVIVLSHLCGIQPAAVPGIVGLSPAMTHTLDHHARGALNDLYLRTDTRE
ncbi:XRE family transcriptional regulator [Streptomyces sp. NPDC086519]|uniref:XRE family transcriptional regulator n=1 Tax=Streptomyces sp. NPDC086519 TaxID=3154863 RepID=UPI0034416257